MTQYTPPFGASGTGHSQGSVPDPGSTAGTTRFLREDSTWALTPTQPPVPPPPPPGPSFNQWACNIAGYLTYDFARVAVKFALDAVPTTWLGDVVGGVVAGVFRAILAEDPIIAAIVEDAVFNWVSGHIVGLASAAIADLLDDVLWKKVHCIVYNAVLATPTDLASILTAAAGAISLLAGYTSAALSCLNYLFANIGLTNIFGIPVGALAPNYDCSTCATTAIGPAVPLQQPGFDLIVGDGTTESAFIDRVDFPGAMITVTGSKASVVPPSAVGSVTATSPLASSGGSSPNISLASPVPTNLGGLGIDTSAFAKGSILANTGSGWNGDAPTLDGLVLTSDSAQPGGVSWAAPGSVSAAGPWYTVAFPPALLSWTKPNPGTALYADVTGGVAIDTPVETANLRMLTRSVTVPYDVIGAFIPGIYGTSGNPAAGLLVSDSVSTKSKTFNFVNNAGNLLLQVGYWSNYTTGVSSIVSTGAYNGVLAISGPPYWFRIKNDGTNRTFWLSRDGVHFLQIASEAHNADLSENSAGFYAASISSGVSIGITLISWSQ